MNNTTTNSNSSNKNARILSTSHHHDADEEMLRVGLLGSADNKRASTMTSIGAATQRTNTTMTMVSVVVLVMAVFLGWLLYVLLAEPIATAFATARIAAILLFPGAQEEEQEEEASTMASGTSIMMTHQHS